MRAALAYGARGLGQVWPNPSVACLIVKDGRLIARARTAPGGRPHAETQALMIAGPLAKGATAYVTLEPCAHHGETPPCAAALIAAGVGRVVVASADPDPRVDGGGIQMLRDAGIEVVSGVLEKQALAQHAGFLSRTIKGRPHVTLKLATTLDGRIATASGESKWITGSEARRHVHTQRALHDAVMIGAGTARQDDPSLTVRDLGMSHQPVRVVLSRNLSIPAQSALTRSIEVAPLWLCHCKSADNAQARALTTSGAKLLEVATDRSGGLDINDVLQKLGQEGLTRIYCEGGSALAASLLQAGLVDQLHLYTAGKTIGAEGLPALGAMGLSALADAPHFKLHSTQALGADVLQIWTTG